MESRWETGVWLGHTRDSNETIIGTKDAAVRAYAVKRMAEDERWNAENIKSMKGLPQQPDPKRAGLRVPIRVTLGEEAIHVEPREVQQQVEPLPRRMGITMTELENMDIQIIAQVVRQRGEVPWQRRGTRKPAETGFRK